MNGYKVNNLEFNEDHGCFTCAMDSGVRIYSTDPLQEVMHLDGAQVGGIKIASMLYQTNLIVLVGGGNRSTLSENTVLCWDDLKKKFVAEITFTSSVKGVKLKRDRLYVAEETNIHVFSLNCCPIYKLFTFDTGRNPRGLLEVSPFPSSERQVLIYPGHYRGSIQVVDLSRISPGQSASPIIISAHDTELVYIAVNQQATLVATASERGTLIRVFDTFSKNRLIELRRGSDSAVLFCINFSSDSDYLCASSDKGTVHIFSLKDSVKNRKSMLSNAAKLVGPMGAYAANSQWSFAKFAVKEESQYICAFGPQSSIYAIGVDGTYYKYVYSDKGTCIRKDYDLYLHIYNDDVF